MKIAAVFFADGFEEIEGLSPVDYLRRGGINVITVGIPTNSKTDQMNLSKRQIVTGARGVQIITDTTLDEYLKDYNEKLPDCIVCPGGAVGAVNLSETTELLAHIEKCFAAGKLTTAICASPAVVFGKTSILKNKNWTCYPGMEREAKEEFLSGYSNKPFITDGNIVTGRGPGASEQFSMELVKILAGGEVAAKVHDSSQQR